MRCNPTLITAAVAMTLGAAAAGAADFTDMFKFNGFGTVGMVNSNEEFADFRGSVIQPDGAGYTRDWDMRSDTKLGLQLSAQFSDKFSAVVQVLSQYLDDKTFAPQIEWANIKYQVTPDFSVRVGRIALPTFLVSETRLVGYANPWVRPPEEVYFVSSVTSNDGVDFSYTKRFGNASNTIQGFYGESEIDLPTGSVKSDPTWGANYTLQIGDASFRLGYEASKLALNLPSTFPLFNNLTALGATLTAGGFTAEGAAATGLVTKYSLQELDVSFLSLGGSYDPGKWFVMAEGIDFGGQSFLSDTRAWYVTGGVRIRGFTPYVTAASVSADIPFENGIPTAGLTGRNLGTAVALNGGVNTTLRAFTGSQDSISAGVRWDLINNVALKVQYDQINIGARSNGKLANTKPLLGYKQGGDVDLISIAVDFVF
jgi:hypothetical protein